MVVRINEQTHQILRAMAQAEHLSMQAVLERAIEEYRRRRFLEDVNDAYAALRTDPGAWEEIQAERAQWEALPDGLPEAETWTEEGAVIERTGPR